MDSAELAAVRSLFPSTATGVHFDHASVSPISTRVADAMSAVTADYVGRGFQAGWRDDIESVRRTLAQLVGSTPASIAFTQNTSTGLSLAANGLDWTFGDNVVLPEHEFPSNYYPWLNLERRGVELRRVRATPGHASVDDLARAVDGRTRVVAVSAVQYSTGYRYDLDAIGELCRRHDVLLVVDGTQSVGALTIDVTRSQVDLLAVSSHKWMLGPSGVGFAHVSSRARERIRPSVVGWLSVTDPFAFDYRLDLPDTADRYEPGSEDVVGIAGLGAAATLFLEHGTRRVEDRVLSLTDRLCDRLVSLGAEIVSPRAGFERSGIVIARTTTDPEALHARLAAVGVRCAVRNGGIRFSPHFYNSEDEVDLAVATIA